MTVDLPQHVYINESVTARVSVFAEQIEEDMTVNFKKERKDSFHNLHNIIIFYFNSNLSK